eukprot:5493721-Amphidinium_carterae.2
MIDVVMPRKVGILQVKGKAVVPKDLSSEQIKAALRRPAFRDLVCGLLGEQTGSCTVDRVEASDECQSVLSYSK